MFNMHSFCWRNEGLSTPFPNSGAKCVCSSLGKWDFWKLSDLYKNILNFKRYLHSGAPQTLDQPFDFKRSNSLTKFTFFGEEIMVAYSV